MKIRLLIISLFILVGCGSAPRGIEDEVLPSDSSSSSSQEDSYAGGYGSSAIDEAEFSAGGETAQHRVSFPGSGFSGGAVTGEGINCNRTSVSDCEKTYPAGSSLRFEIPAVITANGQTFYYSGKIQCNGEERSLSASGNIVVFEISNLDRDYSCSFHFAP